jgi:hypothetical protein
MLKISGVFKGVDKNHYDFKNAKGEQVVGDSFIAYIEDKNLPIKNSLNEVRVKADFVALSKVDSLVEWVVEKKGDKLYLVSENIK